MTVIEIYKLSGDFAENKDIARKLRLESIEPRLAIGDTIILDFDKVTSATQSFIHALISESIRKCGVDIIDKLQFKNCNEKVQTIIEIVVEYVQDGMFAEEDMN
jgi:hypothetical protein